MPLMNAIYRNMEHQNRDDAGKNLYQLSTNIKNVVNVFLF